MRGLIDRILIITPGGLTRQWQDDEMNVKFNIPFTLVNRSRFSTDPTVFHTANRILPLLTLFLVRKFWKSSKTTIGTW